VAEFSSTATTLRKTEKKGANKMPGRVGREEEGAKFLASRESEGGNYVVQKREGGQGMPSRWARSQKGKKIFVREGESRVPISFSNKRREKRGGGEGPLPGKGKKGGEEGKGTSLFLPARKKGKACL